MLHCDVESVPGQRSFLSEFHLGNERLGSVEVRAEMGGSLHREGQRQIDAC